MTFKDEEKANSIDYTTDTNHEIESLEERNGDKSAHLTVRRQHIASIIFMFGTVIKSFGLPYLFIIYLAIKENLFYSLLAGGGLFVLTVILSVLNWWKFTYRVEENELRVERGIFIRKKKYVPINRIHTIDFTANLIHRIFGLVKVKVDTGSGGLSELDLSAITRKEADLLRSVLKKRPLSSPASDEVDEKASLGQGAIYRDKISWARLILAGSTSGGIGALLVAGYLGGSQLLDFIPDSTYDSAVNWFSGAEVVFILFLLCAGIILLYVLGVLAIVVKNAFFTIEKYEDSLFIKRGLIETKELTIPFDRIQSITIKQNLLRQLFGLVSVHASVVGNIMEGKENSNPTLFPIMRVKEVTPFLQKYLPEYVTDNEKWIGAPKRSLLYYMGRSIAIPLLVTGVIAYFFLAYIWIPLIFLLVLAILGFLAYRTVAYKKDKQRLLLRKRFIQKQEKIVLRNRIQAMYKTQHKLQQVHDIASVQVAMFGGLAGEKFFVDHLSNADSNEIGDWYSRKTAAEKGTTYFPGNNDECI